MINGKKCTIYRYVDNTKISHMDPKAVDTVIKTIEKRFGKMNMTQGKSHNFVGMDLVFKDNGAVEIYMKEYIKECIDTFDEVMKKANTPAKYNLFNVEDVEKMNEIGWTYATI